jgi:hypothetical protein
LTSASPSRLLALLAPCLLAACAKVAPPPGGAEDLEAPTVLLDAVQPPPGSGGVDPEQPIVIVFSERPDQRSVLRALRIWPRVDFREVAWEGDTLRLIPDPAWAADRNTLLRIATGAEDRRGNPLESAFLLQFSTKDVPDSGEITGRVWGGRERVGERPIVVLALAAGDSLDPRALEPEALADAERDGKFRLHGLDTAREWRVAGLVDRNDDLVPVDRGEAYALAEETVRFEPGQSTVSVADFLVGTLDTTGTISGEVAADSAAVVFVEAVRVAPDAEVPPSGPWRSRALRAGGRFAIEVPTGDLYRVSAFVDVDGDSLAGESERREERDEPVSLRFTTKADGLRFDLTSPAEEENLDLLQAPAPADSAAPAVETPEEGAAGEGAVPPDGLPPGGNGQ